MIVALLAIACASPEKPTPPPPSPTATEASVTPTPQPIVERSAEAQALRLRAEAFTLARTDSRFDDTYVFNAPAFPEVCGPDAWLFGLIADASFTRGSNSLGDDVPLIWNVQLVEIAGTTGSTVVNVSTDTGRGLSPIFYTWTMIDDVWWLNEPPGDACVY